MNCEPRLSSKMWSSSGMEETVKCCVKMKERGLAVRGKAFWQQFDRFRARGKEAGAVIETCCEVWWMRQAKGVSKRKTLIRSSGLISISESSLDCMSWGSEYSVTSVRYLGRRWVWLDGWVGFRWSVGSKTMGSKVALKEAERVEEVGTLRRSGQNRSLFGNETDAGCLQEYHAWDRTDEPALRDEKGFGGATPENQRLERQPAWCVACETQDVPRMMPKDQGDSDGDAGEVTGTVRVRTRGDRRRMSSEALKERPHAEFAGKAGRDWGPLTVSASRLRVRRAILANASGCLWNIEDSL
ncbi:hypothetical protein R3P38DRAFT_2771953 [Favolaschia claudopus]|uniref:Uncharacterized protein n=1 Tax=Favolaschia claudopus TaxID=2862362 RepID=A0AAW0C6R1_9AGAR